MSFMIFQNEKTPLQPMKTRSPKIRKIDIFPEGLTHAFGPKRTIFPTFSFLANIGQENVFYDILEQKTPFQAVKTRSPKSRKIDIFPKVLTHAFGPKRTIFPTFFFQLIQARKKSFMIFQNEKTPFQAKKTRSPKSQKIDIFPQVLTHAFGPKLPIFSNFCVCPLENCPKQG